MSARSCYLVPVANSKGAQYMHTNGQGPSYGVHQARLLYEFVANSGPLFSCNLGRAAYRAEAFRVSVFADMTDPDDLDGLCVDLGQFVQDKGNVCPARNQQKTRIYETYAAVFESPILPSEADFDHALWEVLQHLHENDTSAWDARTSKDPTDPQFGFSFGGHSFFVVGLHPNSSRISRRFAYPTLVFNSHEQFQHLKDHNLFDRAQNAIRTREMNLQGSINPNLSNFGSESEAKQYSGMMVTSSWTCPFRPKP